MEGTMQKSKTFLMAAGALALSLNAAPAAQAEGKKEKCFGIVKASKNDCAAADGSHSCATYAKRNGFGQDWIGLPAGACDRIIGASLAPTAAEGSYAPKDTKQQAQ
jgi:uncharacterized membrane protein